MIALGVATGKTTAIFKRKPNRVIGLGFTTLSASILGAKSAMSSFNEELSRTREMQGSLNPFLGINENVKSGNPNRASSVMTAGARETSAKENTFNELKEEIQLRMKISQLSEAEQRLHKELGDDKVMKRT